MAIVHAYFDESGKMGEINALTGQVVFAGIHLSGKETLLGT